MLSTLSKCSCLLLYKNKQRYCLSQMSPNKRLYDLVREQDFVEYYLFPAVTTTDGKEEELMLNSVLREVNFIAKKYLKDYIWHKDEFQLSIHSSKHLCNDRKENDDLPSHLHGITHFGSNIEDEWFIVYLLIQLSKEIRGLIVRVVDNDNEFLLIEAANYLPNWAKPETASQRVYMMDGELHIVAPRIANNENEELLKVTAALGEIRLCPTKTVASQEIQEAISRKISCYPSRIRENLHQTKAYLPVAVAAILAHKPNLIAPAILAFCERDLVDLKACRAMKYFPPENRVYSSITFTRFLYAMLTHSKYLPEKSVGWALPAATHDSYRAHLLGVKVACGFEILASQAQSDDKAWYNYLNSLKAKGYFRDLLEHSKEHDRLLTQAREFYLEQRCSSAQSAPVIGQEIVRLSRDLDKSAVLRNEANLPADDSEDWLNISADDLDKLLHEHYGNGNLLPLNKTEPGNFSAKISSFLDHVSTTDGVEFPADVPTVGAIGDEQERSRPNNGNGEHVQFDANSFTCAVQNILNFVIPDDDSWNLEESDSDVDEYGHDEDEEQKHGPMEYAELKSKMEEYMAQMDAELANTTIGESFMRAPTAGGGAAGGGCDEKDNFDDIENFQPVDIDMNALKNILVSYKAQLGEAGPSSTMLGPMGFHLEKDGTESD